MAIDTQSDITTALREYLTDVRDVIPDVVSGPGGEASFSEEGRLHVWSQGKRQKMSIPALVAPRHQLPRDCVALLGVPTIAKLDIALEQHLKLPQFVPLICHLEEKKLREWLEHHPDSTPDTRPFEIDSIQICDHLSDDEISKVKAVVIRAHAHVFEGMKTLCQSLSIPTPLP